MVVSTYVGKGISSVVVSISWGYFGGEKGIVHKGGKGVLIHFLVFILGFKLEFKLWVF